QVALGRRVVRPGQGGEVLGRVVDRHRGGGGGGQGHVEREGGRDAGPLRQGDAVDGQRGPEVVVDDRADADGPALRQVRARGVRQAEEEVLVRLVGGVAVDRDRHRPGGLARGERHGPAGGDVVAAGGRGGAVLGGEGDGDGVVRGGG